MNNNQIQYFLSIVESQSFNQAEKKLYVSRQALKKQIDSLESELGFDLFVRSHLGTTLTPIGEEFYNGIKDISRQLESLVSNCRNLSKRDYTIKIGCPQQPKLILEKAFLEFSKQYPYIKQEVVFINHTKAIENVLDGTVDVAECVLTPETDNSKIGKTRLTDLTYKCLLISTHPLASKEKICFDDLVGSTVGIRRTGNVQLLQELKKYSGITLLETRGSSAETQQIFNICYNQGIFISRSHFTSYMSPLVAVPLDTDIILESSVVYKTNHSNIVHKFIDVVKACYTD